MDRVRSKVASPLERHDGWVMKLIRPSTSEILVLGAKNRKSPSEKAVSVARIKKQHISLAGGHIGNEGQRELGADGHDKKVRLPNPQTYRWMRQKD